MRVDFSATSGAAWCEDCDWRMVAGDPRGVRRAARDHAALVHRDRRARWAYDKAKQRDRARGGPVR